MDEEVAVRMAWDAQRMTMTGSTDDGVNPSPKSGGRRIGSWMFIYSCACSKTNMLNSCCANMLYHDEHTTQLGGFRHPPDPIGPMSVASGG